MRTKPTCAAPGCTTQARSYLDGALCEHHRHMMRKWGAYESGRPPRGTACVVEGCDRTKHIAGQPPMCSTHRERIRRSGTTADPIRGECSVPFCQGSTASTKTLCQLHERRLQDTGSVNGVPPGRPNHAGYLMISCPGHILGRSMTQHRYVLFEKIGYGPHWCHWCGIHLQWKVDLEGDHLNADRVDNRPDNLVPSCHKCNSDRATAGRFKPGHVPANKGKRAA